MPKGYEVKVIDGGSRETCPSAKGFPKWDRDKADKKTSYDTEGVLRSKFDTRVKNEPGFKGMSFCINAPWKK